MRTEMSGGQDDDKVTRSAECLIQPDQLTVGRLNCYRDSPYIALLGPALATANTLVSGHTHTLLLHYLGYFILTGFKRCDIFSKPVEGNY